MSEWTKEDFDFLLAKVEEGKMVLLADTSLGIPTIHGIPNAEHQLFGYFTAVTADYTVHFEGGGAMSRTPSGQGYSVAKCVDGEFPYNFEEVKSILIFLGGTL